MGMFLLVLQKKIGVSIFIVTEIWPGQNTNSKSGSFAKTSNIFGKVKFCFFVAQLQEVYYFWIFLQYICTKGSWRYGSDKQSVTDKRTDGHTRREKQYMSPAGGDI